MRLPLTLHSLRITDWQRRSYAGYGKITFDRRFRVYEISDYGETIRTYKRTEHDEIVDDMILVGKGAPPPYEGT